MHGGNYGPLYVMAPLTAVDSVEHDGACCDHSVQRTGEFKSPASDTRRTVRRVRVPRLIGREEWRERLLLALRGNALGLA